MGNVPSFEDGNQELRFVTDNEKSHCVLYFDLWVFDQIDTGLAILTAKEPVPFSEENDKHTVVDR